MFTLENAPEMQVSLQMKTETIGNSDELSKIASDDEVQRSLNAGNGEVKARASQGVVKRVSKQMIK